MANHNYTKAGKGHGTPLPSNEKYKGGSVPKNMLPTKPGKIDGHGYSGPPIAKRSRGD